MEKRPKRSLSLKKQKKLIFTHSASERVQELESATHLLPVPDLCPEGAGQGESSHPLTPSVFLSGLCNLGNTCYANSILQVLRFCPNFSAKVGVLSTLLLQEGGAEERSEVEEGNCKSEAMDGERSSGEDWQFRKGALAIHLYKLWQRMTNKEKMAANKSSVLSATKPQKFLSRLREEHEVFDNKMQQDAQEMLRFLLNSLHETVQAVLYSLPSPQPPVDLATPTSGLTGDSQERAVVIDDAPSISNLTVRKRKLVLGHRESSKVSKVKRRSASSRKVTDFFCAESSSDHNSTCVEATELSAKTTGKGNTACPSFKGEEDLDFIKATFEGELVSQTRCYECDSWTRRTEPFLDVSIAVSSHSLPGFPGGGSTPLKASSNETFHRGDTVVGPYSLSWALSQFCLREKLRGDNKYCCERCGHLVEAERSVMFGRLPVVMTFHLNRFSTHCMSGLYPGLSVSKIGGNIAIPLTLRFSTWCTQDCSRRDQMYQLFAVIFHTGSSCSSGHYTVCVRGRECVTVSLPAVVVNSINKDTNWVEFDDEVVELMTQQELMDKLSPLTPSSTAYILFYTLSSNSVQ